MVDLSSLRDLSIACALCIVSEFDRWQRRTKQILLPITISKWDVEIVRLLGELGFFALLKTKLRSDWSIPAPNSTRYVNFFSSTYADPTLPGRFRQAIGESLAEISQVTLDLFSSLSEAIANAVEHAYIAPRSDEKRWWLTGSVDHENRRLSVVILDHGIGIPGSLPHSRWLQEISAVLKSMGFSLLGIDAHGKIIEAAMTVGRSRLQQPQRGKGLGDVLKLALADPSNSLRVISGRGYYVFEKGAGSSREMAQSLDGTLIEWNLALPPPGAARFPEMEEGLHVD